MLGTRVLSVCQELTDDPMGKLMEGLFECIDQYESELNGVRTSAAMTEAVRQGFFPGARAPFGYRTKPVEVRPGVTRHVLEVDAGEAEVVRDLYRFYIALGGAKAVARELNQRGSTYRAGTPWDKHLVLAVLEQTAVIGTHWWGKHHGRRARPREEWVALKVEPIVDRDVYELAQRLRASREPSRAPGRAAAKPHLLSGLVRCGRCGASYQLETSGKKVDGGVYRYCYYNCRNACRAGAEVCPGFRISTDALDAAVLAHVADAVCTAERAKPLERQQRGRCEVALDQLVALWRTLVTKDQAIGRAYLLHLVERIDVHETRIVVTQRKAEPVDPGGRMDWDSITAWPA